jgi:hypothetical protein
VAGEGFVGGVAGLQRRQILAGGAPLGGGDHQQLERGPKRDVGAERQVLAA